MSFVSMIPDEVLASFYLNSIAIVLLVGVIVLYGRAGRRDKTEKRIFSDMALLIILLSVSYVFETAVSEQIVPLHYKIIIAEEVLHDIVLNGFCIAWILYANYRMYKGFGYVKRKKWLYLAPFFILLVLNMANMFFPVFRYYGDDMKVHDTALFILQDIIRYGYMVVAAVQLYKHNKEEGSSRFFNMITFVFPAAAGAVLHDLTPYYIQTLSLGMAVGLALLYAEIANEQSFCDRETGFFDRSYVEHMAELISNKKYDVGNVMVFDLEGSENIADFCKILKKQLPVDCEPIRLKKDEILVLSTVNEKAPLFMVAEDVKMSVEEYNEKNSENPMDVKIRYQLKKKKESGYELFDRVLKRLNAR
ncbi:MAG: hypothetical protein K6A69_06190 [Lachnospiraceae bacterium]|nr:hypothetical protein [Lachnospiraceae bacterium]